jgi:glutathione synthase/RimK-type ligase-like ATP-grasp enzyme
MNLLILTRFPAEYEPKRLAEEAEKKGISSEIISYEKITLSWQKEKLEFGLPEGLKLTDFSLIIPRSSAHYRQRSLLGLKTALIRTLPEKIRCLNQETYSCWPVLGKIEQGAILVQKGVPTIPAWFFPAKAERKEFLKRAKFPLIGKARFGSHSQKTFRIENKAEAGKIFLKQKGEFFFQPLIESHFYWRVLVLGSQVLGVMERKTSRRFLKKTEKMKPSPEASGVSFGNPITFPLSTRSSLRGCPTPHQNGAGRRLLVETSTYSPCNRVMKVSLKELGKLALEATQVFKAELTGVDILADKDGQPLVIEVNRSPQFKIFEKRTGINVAEKIRDYLITK